MRKLKNILVTGGAGFIGSNFIHYLDSLKFNGKIINYDNLTYAANLDNLQGLKINYEFVKGDICDRDFLNFIFKKNEIDTVIHFAAESHVDTSIENPRLFIHTNILGTFELLQTAYENWKGKTGNHFHHISTDEVYGSLPLDKGTFTENTPYDPSSPYSASKASSDHIVKAFLKTYKLPITISNCSNNYGRFQHKEKLIPKMIFRALNNLPLTIHGNGKNVRDWLYVEDHCIAIWKILNFAKIGETYNIGGKTELSNIEVVYEICKLLTKFTGESIYKYTNLIEFVEDRPGNDERYSIDISKIEKDLKWVPSVNFQEGLEKTIRYYLNLQFR